MSDYALGSEVDLAILHGVARPCPDCAEERLFVPVTTGDQLLDRFADYSCTWCGAALLIDPSTSHEVAGADRVA